MPTVTLPDGNVLTRLSRQDVLARIGVIPLGVIPYNQGKVSAVTHKRSDCTGLGSYAWATPDMGPGIYLNAYNTASFYTQHVIIPIDWADLLPGDTIGYFAPSSPGNGGHMAIWMGGDKQPSGTFDVWDHGSGMGPKRRRVKWDGKSTGWMHPSKLAPWRYVAIVEADGTTYEPGQSLKEDDMTVIARYGDKNDVVKERLQDKLLILKPGCLDPYGADKGYGNTTAKALADELGVGDGKTFDTGDEANLDLKIFKLNAGTGGGITADQSREIAREEVGKAVLKPGE